MDLDAALGVQPPDQASWYEGGVVRTRLEMDAGHVVEGNAIRFSPRVPLTRTFYIGGELDAGSIDGQIATPPAFRSNAGEMGPTTAVQGTLAAVRLVGGARARAGIISGAAELAFGAHRAELRDANGVELATVESTSTMFEGRGRLDLWLSPRFSIGGVAGVDLEQTRDVTVGLMLGVHWAPYDGMR